MALQAASSVTITMDPSPLGFKLKSKSLTLDGYTLPQGSMHSLHKQPILFFRELRKLPLRSHLATHTGIQGQN